jgi:hypothetical protein
MRSTTERCRHKSGWDYILLPRGFEVATRCRKCGAEFGGEWREEDQGLWVAALDLCRLMEKWSMENDAFEFVHLWRNSLLLGE